MTSATETVFNSQVLGVGLVADKEKRAEIDATVYDYALDVFQSLNKRLNERGLCICINSLKEVQ